MNELRLKAFSARPSAVRTLFWSVTFIVLLAAAAAARPSLPAQAQATFAAHTLRGYDLLAAQTGWVWHGDELDWTEDGGGSWRRITPAAAQTGAVNQGLAAVYFANPHAGWALLLSASAQSADGAGAWLATTADAGLKWQQHPLPADLAAALQGAKTVHLAALNAEQGWVAADLAQSSNFSRGLLWYTADGGATWQERTLPLGAAPQFVDADRGWVAGGPRGDALWRTQDGGLTWQAQPLPRALGAGERVRVYAPRFAADGQSAVLPLLVRGEGGQSLEWYVTSDGGATWQPAADQAGDSLFAADARTLLPLETGQSVLPPVQPLPFVANTAVGGFHLTQVKAATAQAGWALAQGPAGAQLLVTADGGRTWQPLTLPPLDTPQVEAAPAGAAASLDTGSRTSIVQGAGFDACDLPSLAELAAWRNAGPYRTVNLYLGGVLRFCSNERLTAANIAHLAAQGWTFIPTWVGPQAPCSVYRNRFSSDPGTAYAQGGAEADAALAVARSLGLSEADGSGTIIYYDLEYFIETDASCVTAAQAFVSGWTDRLHAAGSQAGLYSTACSPGLARFANISAPPDAIWAAQWNRTYYDPNMNVWNIACVDNTLWSRSQRIRQYTGDHDETWGGVTLNIDSNVLDGPVSDPRRAVPPTSTPTATATATSTPTATPTSTPTPTPQPVTLEIPALQPPAEGGMCGAGWHQTINERGFPAYLAINRSANGTIRPTPTPTPVALEARWNIAIPRSGSYRVEAFIPAHGAIDWQCPSVWLSEDTASAHYTVQHADGVSATVANQAAAKGGWLLLGVYSFHGGQQAVIRLDTATDEAANTRTVSASALRLTRQGEIPSTRYLYLPQIQRR